MALVRGVVPDLRGGDGERTITTGWVSKRETGWREGVREGVREGGSEAVREGVSEGGSEGGRE